MNAWLITMDINVYRQRNIMPISIHSRTNASQHDDLVRQVTEIRSPTLVLYAKGKYAVQSPYPKFSCRMICQMEICQPISICFATSRYEYHASIRQTAEKTGGVPRFVVTNSSSFAFQPKMIMVVQIDTSHDFPGTALNEIRALPPSHDRILGLIRRPLWTDRNCRMAVLCRKREKREREKLETTRRERNQQKKNSPAAADDVGPGGQRPAGLPGDGGGGGGGLPRRHAGGG